MRLARRLRTLDHTNVARPDRDQQAKCCRALRSPARTNETIVNLLNVYETYSYVSRKTVNAKYININAGFDESAQITFRRVFFSSCYVFRSSYYVQPRKKSEPFPKFTGLIVCTLPEATCEIVLNQQPRSSVLQQRLSFFLVFFSLQKVVREPDART